VANGKKIKSYSWKGMDNARKITGALIAKNNVFPFLKVLNDASRY